MNKLKTKNGTYKVIKLSSQLKNDNKITNPNSQTVVKCDLLFKHSHDAIILIVMIKNYHI